MVQIKSKKHIGMDGKKWGAVKDGMCKDKEGKWLKIVDKKQLKWSADSGKTWSDVPDWRWEVGDGIFGLLNQKQNLTKNSWNNSDVFCLYLTSYLRIQYWPLSKHIIKMN